MEILEIQGNLGEFWISVKYSHFLLQKSSRFQKAPFTRVRMAKKLTFFHSDAEKKVFGKIFFRQMVRNSGIANTPLFPGFGTPPPDNK